MSKLLHSCSVKAIRSKGTIAPLGLKWGFARRGTLEVREDSLQCGDWRIPCSEIQEAVLLSTPYLWTKAYVLKIVTEDVTYQFGLNPGAYWQGNLPFPLEREEGGITWVVGNILRIVIIAGIILYLLWSLVQ